MANKPTVEFKGGKKIVKYPDGTVKEHTKESLEGFKQNLTRRKEDINRQITHIDDDITNIENSEKA